MTTGTESRRAWLADCGSALLLSSTTCSALVAGTLAAAPLRGFRNVPSAVSVSSCSASAVGGRLLAICWLLPGNRHGKRSVLVAVDLRDGTPQVNVVPTEFPPETILQMPGGALSIVDDHQGLTPCDWSADGLKQGTRGGLPVRPGLTPTMVDERILVTAEDKLSAIDLETMQVCWRRDDLTPECLASALGRRVICGLHSREIVEVSSDTGQVLRTICRCSGAMSAIACDPHGSLLAYLTCFGQIEVCSARNGQPLWVCKAHGSLGLPLAVRPSFYGSVLAFSPDGCDLVTTAIEREWVLAIWDAQTGERVQTLRGHDGQINGATYLPDGTLLSWDAGGTLRLWDVARGFARRIISTREAVLC